MKRPSITVPLQNQNTGAAFGCRVVIDNLGSFDAADYSIGQNIVFRELPVAVS